MACTTIERHSDCFIKGFVLFELVMLIRSLVRHDCLVLTQITLTQNRFYYPGLCEWTKFVLLFTRWLVSSDTKLWFNYNLSKNVFSMLKWAIVSCDDWSHDHDHDPYWTIGQRSANLISQLIGKAITILLSQQITIISLIMCLEFELNYFVTTIRYHRYTMLLQTGLGSVNRLTG